MATTKKTTARRTTRSRTSTPRAKTTSSSSTTTPAKRDPSLAARTGKAIAKRPVASAAIGTGVVAGVAAAVAGFLAFKKSGKSFPEFSSDVADNVKAKASTAKTKIKATASDASEFVKDGIAEAKAKAEDLIDRRKDGVDDGRTQTEISEEALTLKETGRKTKGKRPVDPVIEEQTKVGAISY